MSNYQRPRQPQAHGSPPHKSIRTCSSMGEPWPCGCLDIPSVCPCPRWSILEFLKDIKQATSQLDINTLKILQCDACPTANRSAHDKWHSPCISSWDCPIFWTPMYSWSPLHPLQPDDDTVEHKTGKKSQHPWYQIHSRLLVFSYCSTGNCLCNFKSGIFISYSRTHNDDKHWLHDICHHTEQALLLVSTNSTEWTNVNLKTHPQAFLAVCLLPVKRWSFSDLSPISFFTSSSCPVK